MGGKRGRLQGLKNVIRFNAPMYLGTLVACVLLSVSANYSAGILQSLLMIAASLITLQTALSLLASLIAYDLSGLYSLNCLPKHLMEHSRILNVNAGFDECTELLASRYPDLTIQAYDFYDPQRHTEASIRRARDAYPPITGTRRMTTAHLPESGASVDLICVILAAHEIRDRAERGAFLSELRRVLKAGGKLVIVEHLRDMPNFIAYNIGALHFFPKPRWESDFAAAGLHISSSRNLNPFIHCWTLMPD